MEKLSYSRLKEIGYGGYLLEQAPEKVMQFGEGNFLRAFVDVWFDLANERAGWNGKCLVVKPRNSASPICRQLNEQQGLYTLYLRGRENGEDVDRRRVISAVSRCINPYEEAGFAAMMEAAESEELEYVVSNTTEAGIVYDAQCQKDDRPASSFPGKLTQVLYRRWQAGKKGLVILSCELIDNNGKALLECVRQYIDQWGLEAGFRRYVEEECTFCSTLVDRIVPGGIRDAEEVARLEQENGYADELAVVGEVFGVWNIEGPAWLEEKLPFRKAEVNCVVVPDVAPYKKRKVRILNGAHTGFVLGAYLAGFDIVRDCMRNDSIRGYMNRMLYEEIVPILPLKKEDAEGFAAAVQDRFNNPFIDHALLSISLNSTAKWRARNMPSLLEYVEKFGKLPECLTMSLACLLAFYTSDVQELNEKGLVCRRPKGECYVCSDDRWALEFFYRHREDDAAALTHAAMTMEQMWGMDLTTVPGLEAAVTADLELIRREGALAACERCLKQGKEA